jgi:methylenetetrahydrofolate dehydrogenase (NADP+)/methenyltetrahydrofolate cyclohydrolase
MPAKIIDGVAFANQIKADVAAQAAAMRAAGRPAHLTALLVGASGGAELYAQRQGEACRALGIEYTLKQFSNTISQRELKLEIRRLNADKAVTGIMMHLPLPDHLDTARLQYEIDVVKDVEGVNPANIGYVVYKHTLIAPCTALAAVELVKSTGVALRGAEAVVVGASVIVGKPVSLLLAEQESTVTLCHIATRDLAMHTRRADVIVVAVGKPGLITADLVKEGAVVVDVGINRITLPDGTKKTTGDVDFEGVKDKAGWITPVPGGVGPVTVAMLMRNTIRSAELLK